MLLNCWKHHAGWVRQRLAAAAAAGEPGVAALPGEMVVVGTRLMDLYVGALTPADIADRLMSQLRDAGVAVLVDVRTAPGSRRHPHVARAELERWLPEAGLSYRWEKRLGGFRNAAKRLLDRMQDRQQRAFIGLQPADDSQCPRLVPINLGG